MLVLVFILTLYEGKDSRLHWK